MSESTYPPARITTFGRLRRNSFYCRKRLHSRLSHDCICRHIYTVYYALCRVCLPWLDDFFICVSNIGFRNSCVRAWFMKKTVGRKSGKAMKKKHLQTCRSCRPNAIDVNRLMTPATERGIRIASIFKHAPHSRRASWWITGRPL